MGRDVTNTFCLIGASRILTSRKCLTAANKPFFFVPPPRFWRIRFKWVNPNVGVHFVSFPCSSTPIPLSLFVLSFSSLLFTRLSPVGAEVKGFLFVLRFNSLTCSLARSLCLRVQTTTWPRLVAVGNVQNYSHNGPREKVAESHFPSAQPRVCEQTV